ncbi:hypothetical protein HAX54_025285 [Datura stramonium]|uniref:Uncharacterized protein n=1 Tax=Datura stramonium TaxID=4076 RepID=A0ABS8S6R8_DATST|nr:hypothetical protein [Datura stramonium]
MPEEVADIDPMDPVMTDITTLNSFGILEEGLVDRSHNCDPRAPPPPAVVGASSSWPWPVSDLTIHLFHHRNCHLHGRFSCNLTGAVIKASRITSKAPTI